MGGKTQNIVVQLVLQQCCKTSCTFLLPVITYLKLQGFEIYMDKRIVCYLFFVFFFRPCILYLLLHFSLLPCSREDSSENNIKPASQMDNY